MKTTIVKCAALGLLLPTNLTAVFARNDPPDPKQFPETVKIISETKQSADKGATVTTKRVQPTILNPTPRTQSVVKPAGIPWLRYIRQQTKDHVHFWPFDGWSLPPNRSVVAEVYPALWSRTFPIAGRTADQQDAFATTEWLRRADTDGSPERFLRPELEPHERKKAEIEGWILGVL